jgi:hypothetical protein
MPVSGRGLSLTIVVAPFLIASGIKSLPSTVKPLIATKKPPRTTCLESEAIPVIFVSNVALLYQNWHMNGKLEPNEQQT